MIKLGSLVIKPTLFPDKTSQVWHLPEHVLEMRYGVVIWNFESESEIMHLAQLKCLLGSMDVTLVIDYLPYARQDKLIGNDTCFALHVFANLLNQMNFKEIKIFDVHSQVALQLIKNSSSFIDFKSIYHAIRETASDTICYPDQNAKEKYFDELNNNFGALLCEKFRDPSNGEIVNITIFGGQIRDKTILMVDDICDGGATFIKLAEKLLGLGAKEVNLYVSHGLFSKGVGVLMTSGIKRVFTAKGEVFNAANSAH